MPKSAKNHNEALFHVCAACFNKVNKNDQKITTLIELKLKKVIQSFSLNDECTPKVLCFGCYIKLYKSKLVTVVDYGKFRNKLKRNEIKCSCTICEITRSNPNPNPIKQIYFTVH